MTEHAMPETDGGADRLDASETIHRSAAQLETLVHALAVRALTSPLDTLSQWKQVHEHSGDIVAALERIQRQLGVVAEASAGFAAAREQLALPAIQQTPETQAAGIYDQPPPPDLPPVPDSAERETGQPVVEIIGTTHLRINDTLIAPQGNLQRVWMALAARRGQPVSAKALSEDGFAYAEIGVLPFGAIAELQTLCAELGSPNIVQTIRHDNGTTEYQLSPNVILKPGQAEPGDLESANRYLTTGEGLPLDKAAVLACVSNDKLRACMTPADLQAMCLSCDQQTKLLPLARVHEVVQRVRTLEDTATDIPLTHYRLLSVSSVLPQRMYQTNLARTLRNSGIQPERAIVAQGAVWILDRAALDFLLAYQFAELHTPRVTKGREPRAVLPPKPKPVTALVEPEPTPLPVPLPPPAPAPIVEQPVPPKQPALPPESPVTLNASAMMQDLLTQMRHQADEQLHGDGQEPEPTPQPPEQPEPADEIGLAESNTLSHIAVGVNNFMRSRSRPIRISNAEVADAARVVAASGQEFPPQQVAANGNVEYSEQESRAIAAVLLSRHGYR